MIPDYKFLKSSFDRYNNEIFSGGLVTPAFTLTRARTFCGKFVCVRIGGRIVAPEIRLSLNFDLPQEEWEDTVIHEMIHYFIAVSGPTDESSHGPTFRRMMNSINRRYGRHISISHRSDPAKPLPARTGNVQHVVCVAVFNSGRIGICRATKTRLFEAWDLVSRISGIREWHWYSSFHAAFNEIPRSLNPKFYLIRDRERWREPLSGLYLMEKDGNCIRPAGKMDANEWIDRHL